MYLAANQRSSAGCNAALSVYQHVWHAHTMNTSKFAFVSRGRLGGNILKELLLEFDDALEPVIR